jgi:pimeloyl-ACP methyl ester carboxylesterase
MRRFYEAVAAVAALLVLVSVSLHSVDARAAAGGSDKSSGKGIVYLFRGGLDIFSTGMNEIAETLRGRGINAQSVGHPPWRQVAEEVARLYKAKAAPVVFVGHSFGANAAMLAADAVRGRGIPVELVILFDPTEALKVPWNVKRVLNFRSLDSTALDFDAWASPGYPGKIENMVFSNVNHMTIDNDADLQQRTVDEVLKVIGGGIRASAQ